MRKMRKVCLGLSNRSDYRERHGGNRPESVYQMLCVRQNLFHRSKSDGGSTHKAGGGTVEYELP
jgi:hypothetical protein